MRNKHLLSVTKLADGNILTIKWEGDNPGTIVWANIISIDPTSDGAQTVFHMRDGTGRFLDIDYDVAMERIYGRL